MVDLDDQFVHSSAALALGVREHSSRLTFFRFSLFFLFLPSCSALIAFDNVRVPVKNLIGKEGQGFKPIMSNFNHEVREAAPAGATANAWEAWMGLARGNGMATS